MLTIIRLAAFDASDKSRRVREEVLNSLEAFTYRGRDYLEDDSFIGASTAAVRATLETALSAASDWIYSDGAEAGEKVLKNKLKELEDIVNPILKRKVEALKRPGAIKELKDTIAHVKEVEALVDGQIKTQIAESSKSSEAVLKASASPSASPSANPLDDLEDAEPSASEPAEPEITEVPTIYLDSDLKTLQDLASKAQKWLDDAEAKQKQLKETDDPAFTIKEFEAEKKVLDDIVMTMMTKKMMHFKPPNQKPKAKPKAKPSKKKADKKSKKDKKAAESEESQDKKGKKERGEGLTDEELQAALKKAGIDTEGIKLQNFGDKDNVDEAGGNLKKLKINKDSTEEEILAAIDDLTGAQEEKHDEL